MRLWDEYGMRLIRYGGVTIVSTIVGLTTLYIGFGLFDWPAAAANLVSVFVSTPFAYYLNRQYVWEQKPGNHSAAREVGPFWVVTFIGWVFSTLVVWGAALISDTTVVVLLAQVSAFATLWLLKFAFLEKFLWNDKSESVSERV